MKYIVLDLEYNRLPYWDQRNTKNANIFEIIEIGAIKLDSDFNIIDNFRIFVKPIIFKDLSRDVMKITNISKEELQYGCIFNLAIKHFKKWIGEEFVFCLWGTDDINVLDSNYKYYSMKSNVEKWFKEFINLQYETSKYLNDKKQISLTSAIERLQILIENKAFHRALDDAYFTTKILQKLISKNVNFEMFKINENKQDNGMQFRLQSSGVIKYEKADQSLIIKCPVCDVELLREYVNRRGNIRMRFLSTCNECKSKVFHYSRTRVNDGKKTIKVFNQIISEEEYNNMSKDMVKILKLQYRKYRGTNKVIIYKKVKW